MKFIVVASQKGGCGKTTLAAHLAVAAELAGNGPVMLIDTDPQATLTYWWKERSSKVPGLIQRNDLRQYAGAPNLLSDIESLRQFGAQVVIIDTPPGFTSEVEQAIQFADLVIVPVRPSPHDLRASAATVQLAKELDKDTMFVLNSAIVRSRISSDAIVALSQFGPLAPVVLHQRLDYVSGMIGGGTALEHRPNSLAAAEMKALWSFIADRLEGRIDIALRQVG
jgi:chromosome partitioning protein